MDMFIIYKKEKETVQKVIDRDYSNGLRSFNIPSTDIPTQPAREKFRK